MTTCDSMGVARDTCGQRCASGLGSWGQGRGGDHAPVQCTSDLGVTYDCHLGGSQPAMASSQSIFVQTIQWRKIVSLSLGGLNEPYLIQRNTIMNDKKLRYVKLD